jgi:hypothetical protein
MQILQCLFREVIKVCHLHRIHLQIQEQKKTVAQMLLKCQNTDRIPKYTSKEHKTLMYLINSQDKSIMWHEYFLCSNVQHKGKKKVDEYTWCTKPHSKQISRAPGIPFNTNIFPTCNSAAINKHKTYTFLLLRTYTLKPKQATFPTKNDATQPTLIRHIKQKKS